MRITLRTLGLLCAAAASSVLSSFAHAEDALARRIDDLIIAKVKDAAVAPACDDLAFARRAYLDLAGRIPNAQEATAFLEDKDANKRAALIDKLLSSPDYPRRMADQFHSMLMERRGDNPEWSKFLLTSFEANKAWDQLAKEILDPDSNHEVNRGAAFFHTKRLEKVGQQDTDYPGLTRDVGRLFLGMDLQCAQCHNHLFIEAYKQQDFQGLFTVYQNTFIRTDLKFPAVGEKLLTKKQDFSSVFEKVAMTTGPRVPGGKEIDIPTFEKNEEYLQAPDRKTNFPGIPRFSPMHAVAQELTAPSNKSFAANFVNRVWFVMMGRGLVNPLDQQHVGNPASHPEVLDALAQATADTKFDLKVLLRQIALSATYQRDSVLPNGGDVPPAESYRVANEKRLTAEQVMSSLLVATGTREKPTVLGGDAEKNRAAFIKAFGNVPTDPEVEFTPSLKSSLFLLNDALVMECLQPKPGNLVERLTQTVDAGAVANELYLSVLTRKPTAEETAAVTEYLAKNSDRRAAAVTNLTWSLLASTEFCLNH